MYIDYSSDDKSIFIPGAGQFFSRPFEKTLKQKGGFMFIHEMVVSIGAVTSAGASVASQLGGMNYSVLFGAFAGSVFYVAGAVDIALRVRAAYFVVSWIVGVFGSGVVGAKLASVLGYSDRPLDGLGAVLLSALAIKTLTFFNQQDPVAWLARLKGGFHGNK